ncbi:c-type cytochrome [Microvirga sp. M2]|uniref:c-type cytochrome n=1 Tax=Microvirga sp. M2 TaxID=3073270 RepID=UPI0039C33B54
MPQVGQSGAPDSQPDSQEHPYFLSSRELIGTDVVDRDNTGRTLGRVDSLIIDLASGRTLYVTLKPDSFLGWERDRIVVPYNVVAFSGRWDRPTLRVPASKIENAPQVRERDLYNLVNDPDWRRAVADYFGSALSESTSGPGGAGQAGVKVTGPRQPATGTPAGGPSAPSNSAGAISDVKAQPGEGATGPTASPGSAAAAAPSAALEPAPAGTGGPDPTRGQALAQRACAACHTLNQGGATRVGPNLFGVTARPIASVAGYNYSNALKAHQGNWDASAIDAFLKNPRGYAPGTYMTFAGISSDRDRRDIVAYLESLKAGASK